MLKSFPSNDYMNIANQLTFQTSEIGPITIHNMLLHEIENDTFNDFDIPKLNYLETIKHETIDNNNNDHIYFFNTKSKTNNNKFLVSKNVDFPPLLNLESIFNFMLKNIKMKKNIKKIFDINLYVNNNILKNILEQLNIKTNKRYTKSDKNIKNNNNILKRNIGRKPKDDFSISHHNKYAPDNIINKIKNILKKYLIIFVNNIINNLYSLKQITKIISKLNFPIISKSTNLIKDIDHKSISNIKKKDENLQLLNYNLKDLLSFNLSSRYKMIKEGKKDFSDYNKKIIEYLLNNVNGDKYKNLFYFVFIELKFEDWLEIFIHQKKLIDFPLFNQLDYDISRIVENSLVRIEDFFDDLIKQGDIYFVCFLLLIYNYKRYYAIKRGRNREKTNDKEE